MRTTITMDDALLETVKGRAAERGTTVSRLIEDSLRATMAPRRNDEETGTFELVTFGKGGQFTDFDVDKVSALIERDDVVRYGRPRE